MKNIKYRAINKKDYQEIKQMINKSFNIDTYITDTKTLNNILNIYLYSCLAEQTYNMVAASENDFILGVIMGQSSNKYNFFKNLSFKVKTLYYGLKAYVISFFKRINLKELMLVFKTHEELLKKNNQGFGGVLTLFAVSKESQGLGIGKSLLNELISYWQNNNTKLVYLFTDSLCNYGFYDYNGFKKIDNQLVNVQGKELDVYFYTYLL